MANVVKLFEEDFQKIIGQEVQFLQLESVSDVKETSPKKEEWTSSDMSKQTCSYCRVEFADTAQQREHYKLDWHRYNLKQSLLSRQPLTEEEFNGKTDDVSSISGSESEKEDNLENIATTQGKVFLKNNEGLVFALYRCLLFDKKEDLEDVVLLKRLQACSSTPHQWTVLMLGGGHFAGGVFLNGTPILHKTFHCYTVRAGQGSSQGARDNRSGGGSQPKSAGASLRRYNEAALVQHVKDIVEAWREEISRSSLVVYRAAGPYNRSVLFGGGKTPLLNRSDPRLRMIPFATRRATFKELKRVHTLLTTVPIYESVEVALKQFPKQQQQEPDSPSKRGRHKSSSINRAKSRENVERPLPVAFASSSSSDSGDNENVKILKARGSSEEEPLETEEQEIELEETLQTFGDSLSPEQRREGRKKVYNKKPNKSKNKRLREREALRRKEIYEVVSSGDLDKMGILLESVRLGEVAADKEKEEGESSKHQTGNIRTVDPVNEVLDEKGNSLLHVAAIFEQCAMIRFLLDREADPCNKNDKQQTPYTCTQNKVVRGVFKDFAKEFPDKYNYNKAQIPTSIVSQEEQAEKKKLLRTVKREKEKEKRKQNAIKKQEDSEKDRFLHLSDREKRALAAEKRILSQNGTVIARCFLCATDISGKVPFEYSGNRFCSIECLKAHRLKSANTVLSN